MPDSCGARPCYFAEVGAVRKSHRRPSCAATKASTRHGSTAAGALRYPPFMRRGAGRLEQSPRARRMMRLFWHHWRVWRLPDFSVNSTSIALRWRQPMARTFLSIYLVCAFATAAAAQHPSRAGQSHACDRSGTTLFFADTLPPIQVSPLPGCAWPGNPSISNRYSPRNRRRMYFVGANHRG